MFQNSSAKFVKNIKKDYKRKLAKEIKIFLKKKNKKSNYMVMNVITASQKMKKVNCFSIEKIL